MGAYLKLERKIGDYATVAVAAHLELADDGTIADAGVGLTSVAPINLKVDRRRGGCCAATPPSDELFAEAGDARGRGGDPRDDVRGTAEWKRKVVRGLHAAGACRRRRAGPRGHE